MWATPPPRSSGPLISFKAGKMKAIPVESKFRVEAEDRRGLALLEKGQDGATHFIWKDRQTLQIVDDLLIFPGDQTLEKVDTGRPNDRVYLLSFKTSASRRFFFWLQEPDLSKDDERVKEFNRLMNEVGATPSVGAGSQRSGITANNSAASTAPIVGLDELSNILSGLGYSPSDVGAESSSTQLNPHQEGSSAEEVMEVEDSSNAPTAPEEEPKPSEKKEDAQIGLTEDDLIRALEGPTYTPNLANIVTGEALRQLIQETDEDTKKVLLSLLPEGRQTEHELYLTLRSPQLRQTFVQISKALNSDNFNMVITNLGLDPRDGATYLQIGDGIGAFLVALEAQIEREEQQQGHGQ